jgi:hypothetical protein
VRFLEALAANTNAAKHQITRERAACTLMKGNLGKASIGHGHGHGHHGGSLLSAAAARAKTVSGLHGS